MEGDGRDHLACSELFVNGSWVGTNEYSLRLRSMVMPKQSLFFVHPEYGATARYPIFLEKAHRQAA